MEANEAPDKIYINPNFEHRIWLMGKGDSSFIEYANTDAFIEKAKNWLNEHISDYECEPMGEYPRLAMLDDFEKIMRGE